MFRFNRRRSRSRGLVFYRVLELAVAHAPVRYRDLIVEPTPKKNPPTAPAGARPPAESGTSTSEPALESGLTWATPVKWIPPINIMHHIL